MAKPKEPPPTTLPRSIIAAAPTASKIAAQVVALEILLQTYEKELIAARPDVIQLARAFVALRRLKDKFKDLKAAFDALFDKHAKEIIPDAFEAAGITNAPLAEGFRVGTSTRTFASIKEGMKEQAFKWMKKNGMGDLIIPTVFAQSLSSAVHYRIEEENKGMPDNLFNVLPVNNTSVTKTEPKKGD